MRCCTSLQYQEISPYTGRTFGCARSGPLLEHLLAQHGEQVLVAAVPVHESSTSRQVDLFPSPEDADSVKPKEIGTAARVLQVSRNTQVQVNTCLVPALADPGSFERLAVC